MPNYYFKVFVRTVKGNIRQAGDKLGDYPAGQLKSIGFWVANEGGQGEAKSWVKSVKEIEELTKFEFFPTLPAEVKEKTDLGDCKTLKFQNDEKTTDIHFVLGGVRRNVLCAEALQGDVL